MPDEPVIPPGSFPVVHLSKTSHTLVHELVEDGWSYGEAKTPEEVLLAASRLSTSRRSISELLSAYEHMLGIERPVTMRF